MARLAGVDLPPGKRAEIGLTYIYGIGRTRSKSLLYRCGIDFNKKIRDLTEDEVNHIRTILEEEGAVEGDLRKEISMNIKRHIEMGSYRGLRHRRSLPVRGLLSSCAGLTFVCPALAWRTRKIIMDLSRLSIIIHIARQGRRLLPV